ncbi:ead/Ea22-like family protein [Citrobacter freundii]|uniref:ead/Ea22-like family protein n=1 Tax=Citrobacter freundii TaxID=546 RepID=UPI00292AB5B2|nr:ead/Ea22-like family protein [Citrobacter freundii]MDV1156786.1 ead/Ea22-like family protein [Citrobacter freundii]MDV1865437.1 ead/Ea22-like family protein [Citrobacter freundii]MEB0421682.1 ead/Ea22-like family protein [Citrobacter freundii]MEB0426596.1 ead/Ea22-like family protein [Citrobacter freundii]MEB0437024.1 ead/Ea22-like family protein [Citrobacter freundii]
MSSIDKRALREAAEKATKGQWAVEFDDEIYSTDGVNHEQIAMVFSENEARDAAFIAAANPTAVLALLDELKAAEKRIAELSASHSKLRDTMAGIHNTIRMDGGYTPLAAILNAAKRAHEESATAAGIGVNGE